MDWDDLRIVLAVARGRTLSAAATTLGVTHTTVGRRLRGIEEALGVRLFDHTPDGYMPTPAGQDIAEVAEQMEAEVLALEGRVLGRDVRLQGALRVAIMDLLFRRYQGELRSFMARYPSVEMTLTMSDDEVALNRREADVALRMTNAPPEYLVGRRIGEVEFAVFGAKALVEERGPEAGLGDYPWLHWDERLNMRWLDSWLAHNAPGAQIAMRVDFKATSIQEAVAAGIGVHFLSVREGEADPRLARLSAVASELTRGVWLLTLPELRSTPRIRALMDHMAGPRVG